MRPKPVTVRFGIALAVCMLSACSQYELAATWNELRGDPYPLDRIPRDVPEGEVAACPAAVKIVRYAGDVIPYRAPAEVAEPFVPKLRAFESAVVEVALEYYGRPPDRLLHFGVRACRSVRGNSRRLSEHALANALDLSGFEWRRVRGHADESGAAPSSPEAFVVSIQQHWAPKTTDPGLLRHQRFLQALVQRLEQNALFRGVIGPGREGHANHLHLDEAPWSYWLF
jgi:hypothetical protein